MRATAKIAEVPDCESIRLYDAPVCKFLQMLDGVVGVPKHSIVIKYRHGGALHIRVLGATSSKTRCLRAKYLGSVYGEEYLGELRCRIIQPNETFEITVHEL